MSKFTGKLGELYQTYSRTVSMWPVDKLRPSHCYKNVLKQQMETKFNRLNSFRGQELNQGIDQAEQDIAALKNLLSNKYKSKYKVSESLNDPISNKGYYTKLLASIDAAVKSNKRNTLRVD